MDAQKAGDAVPAVGDRKRDAAVTPCEAGGADAARGGPAAPPRKRAPHHAEALYGDPQAPTEREVQCSSLGLLVNPNSAFLPHPASVTVVSSAVETPADDPSHPPAIATTLNLDPCGPCMHCRREFGRGERVYLPRHFDPDTWTYDLWGNFCGFPCALRYEMERPAWDTPEVIMNVHRLAAEEWGIDEPVHPAPPSLALVPHGPIRPEDIPRHADRFTAIVHRGRFVAHAMMLELQPFEPHGALMYVRPFAQGDAADRGGGDAGMEGSTATATDGLVVEPAAPPSGTFPGAPPAVDPKVVAALFRMRTDERKAHTWRIRGMSAPRSIAAAGSPTPAVGPSAPPPSATGGPTATAHVDGSATGILRALGATAPGGQHGSCAARQDDTGDGNAKRTFTTDELQMIRHCIDEPTEPDKRTRKAGSWTPGVAAPGGAAPGDETPLFDRFVDESRRMLASGENPLLGLNGPDDDIVLAAVGGKERAKAKRTGRPPNTPKQSARARNIAMAIGRMGEEDTEAGSAAPSRPPTQKASRGRGKAKGTTKPSKPTRKRARTEMSSSDPPSDSKETPVPQAGKTAGAAIPAAHHRDPTNCGPPPPAPAPPGGCGAEPTVQVTVPFRDDSAMNDLLKAWGDS